MASPVVEETVLALQQRLQRQESCCLLDVRELAEWQTSHLPNALHIPMGQIQLRLDELPKQTEIIVYCRSGGRSARVCQQLQQAGFSSVKNLQGGMLAWQRQIDPSLPVG